MTGSGEAGNANPQGGAELVAGASAAGLNSFSDADARRIILRALRLLVFFTVIGAGICWWKFGWPDALLLCVGAVVSGSGIWEWMRMMTAIMARMDAGGKARPVGRVTAGFFLRLCLILLLAYASLRYLDGSVYALAAGLGLGVAALTLEGLRLLRAWTV